MAQQNLNRIILYTSYCFELRNQGKRPPLDTRKGCTVQFNLTIKQSSLVQ
eukprot:jgi/Botrbrau1/2136/Bobra.0093s0043.1